MSCPYEIRREASCQTNQWFAAICSSGPLAPASTVEEDDAPDNLALPAEMTFRTKEPPACVPLRPAEPPMVTPYQLDLVMANEMRLQGSKGKGSSKG